MTSDAKDEIESISKEVEEFIESEKPREGKESINSILGEQEINSKEQDLVFFQPQFSKEPIRFVFDDVPMVFFLNHAYQESGLLGSWRSENGKSKVMLDFPFYIRVSVQFVTKHIPLLPFHFILLSLKLFLFSDTRCFVVELILNITL